MKNTALIIIDIQNDYFPGGALILEGTKVAAMKARQLLTAFRQRQQPIVHIQQENVQPEMGFMLSNTLGQKIHESVEPVDSEICFTKHYPNAFWQTKLETHLKEKKIENLVVVGMMTHMCVSSTVRAAMERGFGTTVIQDACATCPLEFDGSVISAETVHNTALAELTLVSTITSTDRFLSDIAVIKA